MDELALPLVKASIGISTNVRDDYLKAIISGIVVELGEEKKITLDKSDNRQLMLIVDYAVWRYQNHGAGDMPRHLRYRLNNMMIHEIKQKEEESAL